jgi:hypothetical protein
MPSATLLAPTAAMISRARAGWRAPQSYLEQLYCLPTDYLAYSLRVVRALARRPVGATFRIWRILPLMRFSRI